MNSETRAALSFSLSPKVGPKTFLALLSYFKTSETAWDAEKEELEQAGLTGKTLEGFLEFRKTFSAEKYVAELQKKSVTVIAYTDERYPKSLKHLPNPPIVLYVKGNIELLYGNSSTSSEKNFFPERNEVQSKDYLLSIAVVGNRKITSYGKQVTEKITSDLVSSGFTIVSGLALGVDATAHKTALEQNGNTIAVLGCGVDCCFPAENQRLYDEILERNGIIISEYPLSMEPNHGTFPARNRIVAALSQATLVTEAAADSGALITAEWAEKLGKPVFAVPGPITSKQSDGTAILIKKGATLISSGQDILEKLEMKPTIQQKIINIAALSDEEKKIVELLQSEELIIDDIAKLTKIPIFKLSPIISQLELKGIVKNTGNRMFGINN